jgi:glycosyltransferase involved in cell wall biosynthesis
MVQTLIDGLPAHGIAAHHVNLGLSRDAADIGRWRAGKFFAVFGACFRAIAARFRHDCDTLYYVPAPGKRGALYRDWIVMLLCRPFFAKLVLHWHATGLGEWLASRATAPERWITQLLLGRADLSIVLAEALRGDATALRAKKIAIVANGIVDPLGGAEPPKRPLADPFQVLFLGLCSEEKGLFATAEAVLAANQSAGRSSFALTAAGPFPDAETERRFQTLAAANPSVLLHIGFVNGAAKTELLQRSDCLCLPTRYPLEGQPLVLLEAMAHDLPIIATRWRGIPETLPSEAILVEPGDGSALKAALITLPKDKPPAGSCRRYFLAQFTAEKHLTTLTAALSTA